MSVVEYTITDEEKLYQVPRFTPDPSWCQVSYSYNLVDTSVQSAIDFDEDENVRTFCFEYSDDLDLCGDSSKDYTIEVIA